MPVSYTHLREIAERQGFSDKYLEGIVSRLSSAGLVKSGRGKYGGYRLVKAPSEYNVYEILYAAEDSIALVSCLEDDVEPCPMFNDCLTAPLWQYLQDELDVYKRQGLFSGRCKRCTVCSC